MLRHANTEAIQFHISTLLQAVYCYYINSGSRFCKLVPNRFASLGQRTLDSYSIQVGLHKIINDSTILLSFFVSCRIIKFDLKPNLFWNGIMDICEGYSMTLPYAENMHYNLHDAMRNTFKKLKKSRTNAIFQMTKWKFCLIVMQSGLYIF